VSKSKETPSGNQESNEPTIIPNQESLIEDLLSMDIGTPAVPVALHFNVYLYNFYSNIEAK
jgi:hypothetical protein